MESLDDIMNELNYHEMWYKWVTTKSPNNREIVALDSMPKQKQFLFLQKKVGNK